MPSGRGILWHAKRKRNFLALAFRHDELRPGGQRYPRSKGGRAFLWGNRQKLSAPLFSLRFEIHQNRIHGEIAGICVHDFHRACPVLSGTHIQLKKRRRNGKRQCFLRARHERQEKK